MNTLLTRRLTNLEMYMNIFGLLAPLAITTCSATGFLILNLGFILTTSPTVVLGSTHKVCLTLHHVTGKAHVQISLKGATPEKKVIVEKSLDLENEKLLGVNCVDFKIPSELDYSISQGVLGLKITFDSLPEYQINESKEVEISRWIDQQLIFVESDLQVYKPNDVVRIRILTLTTSEFKPVLDPIKKITIENPSGIRIAQWLNVSTDTGLGQIEFPLSSEPKTGVWKIHAENFKTQSIESATFEVREYVLPRFKVVIEGPSNFVAEDKIAQYKICGKYSYGKPVQGKIQVITDIYNKYSYQDADLTISSEWLPTDKSGCASHAHQNFTDLSKIVLKASLQEEGTEKTENTTLEVGVRSNPLLRLDFINTDGHIKPGFIYTYHVKAVREDTELPVKNEALKICLTGVLCKEYTTNDKGIATVQFARGSVTPPENGFFHNIRPFFQISAQPENADIWGYAGLLLSSWYSPSGTYLNILRPAESDNAPLSCGKTYSFVVEYLSSKAPKELFYIVQARREIVYQSKLENNLGNNQYNKYNLKNVLQSSNITNTSEIQIPKLVIDFEITPKMAPKSSLLVYYVTEEGETVSASATFEVEKCFTNEVEQSWSATKPYPGETVNLRLQTAPNSLCAISSVDESTQYLKLSEGNKHEDGTRVTSDWVYKALQRKGIVDVKTYNGDPEYCDNKIALSKKPSDNVPTTTDGYYYHIAAYDLDAVAAFDNAGVVVLSNFQLDQHNCYKSQNFYTTVAYAPPPAAVYTTVSDFRGGESSSTPTETIRDNFPDSWLWELVHVSDDGKLDVPRKLPDTITNWITSAYCISPDKGLGVTKSPISTLTAFQPFFVEFSPPYSVKRGEIIHQNVQVFNYLPDSLPVSVSLESADGLSVTMPDGKVKRSVCIPSEEAGIIPISINAQKLGHLNVSITAAIDSEYSEKCGPETVLQRSDKLIKPVFVQPEGFPVEISKSTMMCPNDFPKDAAASWNFSLPENVVADSARAYISVSPDLLGQALENLDHLVQLPMGCGEQNMILFVPNLVALKYFKSVGISKPKLEADAIKNLKIGYERELNYRHDDGSFSAFGSSDSEGSTWLTAFVIKSFSQAKEYIFIDDEHLRVSQNWLIKSQHENGCFPNIGRVVHKELTGGLGNSTTGLTAFILIALLNSPLPINDFVTRNAKLCITRDTSDFDVYTQSLVTYAHALLDKDSEEAKSSLEKLLQKAHSDDGIYWWGSEENSLAVKIETTSYAILSFLKHGGSENIAKALGAVRWLSKHRNSRGGFESTQDTVLALEALASYAQALTSKPSDLQLAIKSGDISKTIRLNKETSGVLQTLSIDSLPSIIDIQGTGEGCGMVQGTLRYNVHTPKGSDAFEVEAEVLYGNIKKIKICAWYKLPDGASNMAVIEVDMVTGYEPDHASLVELQEAKVIKRFDGKRDKVILYFDQLQAEHTCVKIGVTKTGATVENAKPAKVKVYDYYSPELIISTSYQINGNAIPPPVSQ